MRARWASGRALEVGEEQRVLGHAAEAKPEVPRLKQGRGGSRCAPFSRVLSAGLALPWGKSWETRDRISCRWLPSSTPHQTQLLQCGTFGALICPLQAPFYFSPSAPSPIPFPTCWLSELPGYSEAASRNCFPGTRHPVFTWASTCRCSSWSGFIPFIFFIQPLSLPGPEGNKIDP